MCVSVSACVCVHACVCVCVYLCVYMCVSVPILAKSSHVNELEIGMGGRAFFKMVQ